MVRGRGRSKDREIRKHGKAEAKRLRNLLRERNADSFRSLETPALEDDEEPEPVDESIARRVRAEMSETEGRNRIELGEIEKGERLLREAADLGSFKAFSALVGRLADRGDRDELARMLEQELGEDRDVELPRVRVDDLRMTLANVFLSRADAGHLAEGDVEGGLRLLREVAEGGHDDLTREGACRRLHHWHDKWGHAEEAASWLRRIQARESADALEKRGGELIDKGQIKEGERVLREAADGGSVGALLTLARRLKERGDRDGLERWLEYEMSRGTGVERHEDRVSWLKSDLATVLITVSMQAKRREATRRRACACCSVWPRVGGPMRAVI